MLRPAGKPAPGPIADGDPDLLIGFADPKVPAKIYRNDQKGARFTDVAAALGVSLRGVARQPAWIDYDGDGELDLFMAFRDVANNGTSALYRNEAGKSFTAASAASGISLNGHGVTSAWGDLNNDGLPDLCVGNFIAGQPLYRDALFVNRDAAGAAWSFTEALPDVILKHDATHGVQFADFDGDGRVDLALTNNDSRRRRPPAAPQCRGAAHARVTGIGAG